MVRDDGTVFSNIKAPWCQPIEHVGLSLEDLSDCGDQSRLWSGPGVQRYMQGEQPEPADVFKRTAAVVDKFVHFHWSIASQDLLCEFVAVYAMGTYFLPAFDKVGYLWVTGVSGSEKTHLLTIVAELSFLGNLIIGGGTYPTLRDDIGAGVTVCLDDFEETDEKKRELILSGSRRGSTVGFKLPGPDRTWRSARASTFSPKCFSAIALPDPILGNRCVVIPMVKSDQIQLDPLNISAWPHDRRRLIDDLWAICLRGMSELPAFYNRIPKHSRLMGRDLDPWQFVLAVALWLQERHGVDGLFDRIDNLTDSYQAERYDLESGIDLSRLVVRALVEMVGEGAGPAYLIKTKLLTQRVNALAAAQEDEGENSDFTNERTVGRCLRRFRLNKATPGRARGKWLITRAEADSFARAHGVAPVKPTNTENAKNTKNNTASGGPA